MTIKHNHKKSIQKSRRQPPIVVVPDKTYIDDTGSVIPTDVILVSDLELYEEMRVVLEFWDKEPTDVPGQKGAIKG